MIALTTPVLVVLLTATLIPSAHAFTYPMYSYRRASRSDNYQYDQPQPTYYNGHRGSFDESESGNYYVDERNHQAADRVYYYGKPTYHGEYKPTRYYYARAPNYNYNDDHSESENPLDDLHSEMLQEDQRDSQRHMPVGQPEWFQNTGPSKSLTSNFIKNLILYNDGYNPIEQQSESDLGNGYNGYNNNDNNDDVDEMYESLPDDGNFAHEYANALSSSLSGQHAKHTLNDEPNHQYDYYDTLMETRPSLLTSSQSQNYYFGNRNQDEYNHESTYADYEEEPKVDKEEQDLKSLRKHHFNIWDSTDNEKFDPFAANMKLSSLKSHNIFSSSNSGFETGNKDYVGEEDGPWINWDRKRSLKQKYNGVFGPLKDLEYRLTLLQKHAKDINQLKMSTTSVPSTTTIISSLSNSKIHDYKGQKEILFSRPVTQVRHHFSDSATSTSEQQKTYGTDKIKTVHKSWPGTKKLKRFVSNEALLVQQLNGLRGKIRA